jgi:heme oxygenase
MISTHRATMSTPPPPPPQTKPTPRTLQQELAAAIRQDHASLNALLSSRLPLSLPPHTTTPYLFTAGLTVFGHLYTGFESAWSALQTQPTPPPPYLSKLHTPGLSRHARLHADLQTLTSPGPKSRLTEPQRRKTAALRERTAHIHTRIDGLCREKPHLVLAYAWTLYLALFNGGRYIRSALEESGDAFWGVSGSKQGKEAYPLSFWRWKGDDDGVAIEQAFHVAFDRAAEGEGEGEGAEWAGLDRRERDEVVDEARAIFSLCHELVGVLDREVGAEVGGGVLGGVRDVVVLGMLVEFFAWGWWWFVGGLVALGRACRTRPRVEGVSA